MALNFPTANIFAFHEGSKATRNSRVFMPSSREGGRVKKSFALPNKQVNAQVTHSMPPEKREIFKSLDKWAEENVLVLLKDVEKSWQPTDFLPDPTSEGFHDQVLDLRERSKGLPHDYLVVLVGEMIVEEGLPSYQQAFNIMDGVEDETGASPTPWARWSRAWTAEENRHGDLLNKYLYLTGRVDMRQIEKTIQYEIGRGFNPRHENNPYLGFVYTSLQERATFISHSNTAKVAKACGDVKLAQICRIIAADEKRHETAYTKIVEKLFEIDPDATVLAAARVMENFVMPGQLMYDGKDENLFSHLSDVAQRLGIFGTKDYVDILDFMVRKWKIETLTGLSSEGRKAQDYACRLPERLGKLEERAAAQAKKAPRIPFSWIFNKEVQL